MAQTGTQAPAGSAPGIPQELVAAATAALDQAFIETMQARYGGGINAAVLSGGRVQEQLLRAPAPNQPGHLLLELHVSGDGEDGDGEPSGENPAGFSQLFQGLATVIGDVTMRPAPGGRVMEVKVLAELFDERGDCSFAADASHPAGVLLHHAPAFLPGTPGSRIDVVRSQGGQQDRALAQRQGQRGWLPSPVRTKSNRGGGLGVNGRVTAAPSSLCLPISATLLRRIAGRLVQAEQLGEKLQRVVLGLEHGDAS